MIDNDKGIACPSCGGRSAQVKDSRGHPNGVYTRRRRLCACGFRFTTQEIVVEPGQVAVATNRAALTDSILTEIGVRLPLIVSTAVNQSVWGKARP